MIRLTTPLIEEDDLEAVRDALASGYLVQGRHVACLEAGLATWTASEHVVVVSSGTAALHLALLGLGIGRGSRVAVPAYSFLATANVVELVGAEPVFVDVETETFAMDPAALARAHAAAPVDVVMPVHPFGHVADMAGLAAAAPGAVVVEDAAAALGARRGGVPAGAFGAAGCFSFHPRKALTTGEGGAITTADPDLARRLRALRNHGLDPDAAAPDFVMAGLNYRMTDVQAALGTTQLAKFGRIVDGRRAAVARYDRLLAGTAVRTPPTAPGSEPVWQSYLVLLPEGRHVADLVPALRAKGVEAQIGTYHMPLTSHFRARTGTRPGDFPGTDLVAARALALPLSPTITAAEQEEVAARLLEAL